MDIKIESRNVGMTPRWKTEIENRVAALETDSIHITHARVTLTKNAHHKKGADNAEALVLLTVPRRHTVTARKEAKTFEEAIRKAFQAAATEIRKMHEKRVAKEPAKSGLSSLNIETPELADENVAQGA
ncbi:MAG: HPF/RaiA family ribosome-associated protein [Nitrospirales bacterium]